MPGVAAVSAAGLAIALLYWSSPWQIGPLRQLTTELTAKTTELTARTNELTARTGELSTQVALDNKVVELAIIRVLQINKAAYLLSVHLSKLAAAAGLSARQIKALPRWRQSKVFDERERAVLNLAESMTKTIRVAQSIFDALRRHFDERQIVELTVIIGCYNMHSRVLEALEIPPGKVGAV